MNLLRGLARLRPQRPEDRDFLLSSWLRSCAKSMPSEFRDAYYTSQHRVVSALIDTRAIVVACASDDENQIIGWACGETTGGRSVLHWCYVKSAFRGHGVARALVSDVLGQRLVRPVMSHQVQWSTIGRKLMSAGWDIQPTLGVHLVNAEGLCADS